MNLARARKPVESTNTKDDGSLGAAIEQVRRAPAEDEVAPLARAVSTDWGAEREADAVADAATRSFSGPALEGDRLSTGLQDAMRTAAPDIDGLGAVQFDQSDAASQAADSIGALAFTKGSDVSVANGELTPHLAAHEAAHATMHADDGAVHAKLRGTKDALQSMAGEPGKKVLGGRTNWEKIVEGVGAYESLESAVLAGGKNPTQEQLQAARNPMIATLRKVQTDVQAWHKANNSKKEDKKKAKVDKKRLGENGDGMGGINAESDDRSKAARRQAIAMLTPRVADEKNMLENRDSSKWISSLGLNPSMVTKVGKKDEGQKNPVQELTYQTEQGEFSGFFKKDKGFTDIEQHEARSGITQMDPNYGARSVAMYRLDQLFNANVTARAEFATHVDESGKTHMGTVLESAKGKQMSKRKVAMNSEQAKQMGNDTVAFDDPVLQRGINKLQILDAICGQLDRHTGNYVVETDGKGKVIGVTGIDLDMSFGKNKDDPEQNNNEGANKGMPAVIDEEFGKRILEVDNGMLTTALIGLLPMPEIQATIRRFNRVKDMVRELNSKGKLKNDWESGAYEGVVEESKKLNFMSSLDSYKQVAAADIVTSTGYDLLAIVQTALQEGKGPRPFQPSLFRRLDHLPELAHTVIVRGAGGGKGDSQDKGPIVKAAVEWAFKARQGDKARELVMLLLNEFLRDNIIDTISVQVQELKEGDTVQYSAVVSLIEKRMSGYMDRALKQLKTEKTSVSEQAKGGGRKSMLGSRK